jgi:predicted DNA-binding transcriptional regulator AlpA
MPKLEQNTQKNNPLPENLFNAEALQQYIQDCVKDELAKQNASNVPQNNYDDDWIGTKELMKITGLTKQNVYQKSFHCSFPFPVYKSGKKLRFKRSEVLSALNRQIQTYEIEANAKQRAENYLVNGKK